MAKRFLFGAGFRTNGLAEESSSSPYETAPALFSAQFGRVKSMLMCSISFSPLG